jgi:hypothetical protein
MPSDNRNNPPKPNKDQKVTDLPQKKGSTSKDAQVKGGRANKKLFEE